MTKRNLIAINKKSANYITAGIFAPVLILTGVAEFLIPAQHALTSVVTSFVFNSCDFVDRFFRPAS
jgi:hypothetical protein